MDRETILDVEQSEELTFNDFELIDSVWDELVDEGEIFKEVREHLENTPDDHDQSEHDPGIGGSAAGRRALAARRGESRQNQIPTSDEVFDYVESLIEANRDKAEAGGWEDNLEDIVVDVPFVMSSLGPEGRSALVNNLEEMLIEDGNELIQEIWDSRAGDLAGTVSVAGFWNRFDKQVAVSVAESVTTTSTLYHELAHALDHPVVEPGIVSDQRISSSPEWVDVWESEINTGSQPLSAYAETSSLEGFAEFGRAAWEQPDAAKENFPRAWQFWVDRGFVEERR